MFTTIDATYDNGQGTTDKSIDQYDQDTDIYMNAASEYASEHSTADRRSKQLEVHSTQGNGDVTYDTVKDQTHAMEEDQDQDQGEDHCSSMVYHEGYSTNTYTWKQRRQFRNKQKSRAKKKANKVYKEKQEQNRNCLQNHNKLD